MDALQQTSPGPSPDATLTKAVLRAARILGLSQATLATVLGVSPATVSRLHAGKASLSPARAREWEFALLFVRLYRALDAIVGGEREAQAWLRGDNTGLGGRPIELMQTAEGLVRVLHYLDAHRSRL